jgi:ribosomal protein S18 acetylase RimI-like enzyme
VGADGRVVGHAMYVRTGPEDADVAIAVADELQGKGLGTILVGQLAEAANANRIASFQTEVLPQNHRMIEVFRESGFPMAMRSEPGAIVAELPRPLSRPRGWRAEPAARPWSS